MITSISSKVSLIKSVRNAVDRINKNIKIIGADSNSEAIARYFVDDFWIMPPLETLTPEELFFYCKKNRIGWIIPTRDGELEYFSNLVDEQKEIDINIMVSNIEVVRLCLDKYLFHIKLKDLYNFVIPTFQKLENVKSEKLVVKERFGSGSNQIGLNMTKKQANSFSKGLQNPIFQPYIFGTEYTVDIYLNQSHEIKGIVTRERLKVVDGESHLTKTVYNKNLESICKDIVKKIHFKGHINLQFIKDTNGNFHLIECNPRFGGASSLSLAVGLDSFYWFILETSGFSLAEYPFIRERKEKILIKYLTELIIED